MREIALHVLDIAENSVSAGATQVAITITEDTVRDRLQVTVSDNGRGMEAATAAQALEPFVTTRTTRKVGLGLPLLKEAAEACKGWLTLESEVGRGTTVQAEFQRSHIDRMPLGDLAGTMMALEVGFPAVNWQFTYTLDGRQFHFDDSEFKRELGDLSITEPDVLAFLRETLETGLTSVTSRNAKAHWSTVPATGDRR